MLVEFSLKPDNDRDIQRFQEIGYGLDARDTA
jgi:hypothetical protein